MRDRDPRLLTRIVVRNYKSIGHCDVRPGPLAFLVGPNGSGKSNFLDALRFLADALRYSLDHALRDRGGFTEVRRQTGNRPNHFGVRVEFQLPEHVGFYAFQLEARPKGTVGILREECQVDRVEDGSGAVSYLVEDGVVLSSSFDRPPAAANDRLYLVSVSGMEEFRPTYDALSGMGFYNLSPSAMRDLQSPGSSDQLRRDGSNIASVLARLEAESPAKKRRIEEYLSKVVPGVVAVHSKSIGSKETLEFHQGVGSEKPFRFLASSMSDGTLRALGILVALFQSNGTPARRLIGIEEPETALHPAAAGAVRDALRDASIQTQVLVSSHSPDLLDDDELPEDAILSVVCEDGETRVSSLDDVTRSVLRDHLYTAGELLRMDQLPPSVEEGHCGSLFGREGQ